MNSKNNVMYKYQKYTFYLQAIKSTKKKDTVKSKKIGILHHYVKPVELILQINVLKSLFYFINLITFSPPHFDFQKSNNH